MQMEGFFNWLGENLGDALRSLLELLSGFFAGIGAALYQFIEGLADALNIETSLFNLGVLVIGLLLLFNGLRSLLRRSLIGGTVWTLLGLAVLSWLIA